MSRFLSPFDRRHSLLGHPIPARGSALLTVGPPAQGRTQTGLPRSARTRCDRGGCPLYPEDSGARPARSPPRPAPAASQRQSLYPATTSHHARLRFTRHQQRFKPFTRPVFPSPAPPGWNRRRFGFPPELRTPPSPVAHVRGGDRPSSTDLEQRFTTSAEPPILRVHSMRATSRRTATSRSITTLVAQSCFRTARAGHPSGCRRCWIVRRAAASPRLPRERRSKRGGATKGSSVHVGRARWPVPHTIV
jgi:hypothetical protein